ncbi:hypothetical protein BMS3Bbin01_02636 [bacterium BMS3Bbin01]|nr:hypothetical protein BMS3Bbin01_02636 [bacterium BMS3Bbin01]
MPKEEAGTWLAWIEDLSVSVSLLALAVALLAFLFASEVGLLAFLFASEVGLLAFLFASEVGLLAFLHALALVALVFFFALALVALCALPIGFHATLQCSNIHVTSSVRVSRSESRRRHTNRRESKFRQFLPIRSCVTCGRR